MSASALIKAIQIVTDGNQTKFAKALTGYTGEKVSQQIVNYWTKGGNGCSERFASPIEELTQGEVTKEELCPDFHWPRKEKAA